MAQGPYRGGTMGDFGTETDHLGRTQIWREKVINFRNWRENGTSVVWDGESLELKKNVRTLASSNYDMTSQGHLGMKLSLENAYSCCIQHVDWPAPTHSCSRKLRGICPPMQRLPRPACMNPHLCMSMNCLTLSSSQTYGCVDSLVVCAIWQEIVLVIGHN